MPLPAAFTPYPSLPHPFKRPRPSLCPRCASAPYPIHTRDGAQLLTHVSIPATPTSSPRAAVLLHDFMTDHRLFSRLLPALSLCAPSHAVLTYDLRGFGRSSVPSHPYSRNHDLDDAVAAALPAPFQNARLDLVGVGLGGAVALEYALHQPGRVRSVVVVGSALPGHAWGERDLMDMTAAQKAARLAMDNRARGYEGAWEGEEQLDVVKWKKEFIVRSRVWAEALGGEDRELAGELLEMVKTYGGFHFFEEETVVQEEEVSERPLRKRLGGMQAPVLVMVGKYDSMDYKVMAQEIWNEVGGEEVVVVKEAGHFVALEKAEQVAERVSQFWERLNEFGASEAADQCRAEVS